MPTPSAVSLRRGFWCTAETRSAVTGDVGSATGREAATVTEAVRLVRVSLRTLTPALTDGEADRAFRWLELGQWEAVHRLLHGGDLALAFRHQDAEVEWRVRPVLFLAPPLRSRSGTTRLSCARAGVISAALAHP